MQKIERGTSFLSQYIAKIFSGFLLPSIFAIALAGCSKGSSSVDDFVGQGPDDDQEPVYNLTFDPTSYDFGPLLITSVTPLSKSVTVTNNETQTLFVTSVAGTASSHFTLSSQSCTALITGLATGQSCSFVVEFLPTAGGLHNFTVNVEFGLTLVGPRRSGAVNFLGTGALPANLVISDGPTYNYGAVVATASVDKSFTVTNTGNIPATTIVASGLAAPFDFKGGSFPGTGGNCSSTLAAGASCSMVVTFNPSTTGLATDTIVLDYDDGTGAAQSTRNIQGTGATPAALSISDGPGYDYGTYAIGGSADKIFTVSNSGGVSATSVTGSGLTAPFSFKGGTFPGTGGNCGSSIASGASCTVVVTFAPTATGTTVQSVQIGYNDGLSAQSESRAVQGTAVTPASLSISDGPTYNYGSLIATSTADHTFTVSNSGGFGASFMAGSGLAAPFSFKGGSFPGTGGTCGASLPAGSNCTIVVTYAPTAAGSFNDIIDITYVNGASSQTASRAVQGLAVSPANLSINSGPTYNFGTLPTSNSATRTFTVTNLGQTLATAMTGAGLAAPYSFLGGSYPGTGGTCAATLASSANCTIVVEFAPTTVGTHNDTIEINFNNGLIATMSTRDVTGVGVTPASLSISDGPTYDYGIQPIGKATDKTFTVTNAGGFGASSISGGGLAAPFTFKGGSFPGTGGTCGATLAASGTCTIVVTYTVAATVVSSDSIEVSYNDGNGAQLATRAISGTGVTAAALTLSDGPAYDFGPVATGNTVEKTITVTNTGTFAASSMSGGGLAAPFIFKGGSYPGTGGTCGTTLSGSANCTIVVTFAPTVTGNLSDAVDISYNNGVSAQSVSRTLQGIGTLPASLVISDGTTYNFGSIPFGATATKSFTVTNVGGVPSSSMTGTGLASPFSFLGGTYPGTGGTCGSSLAASGTCTIVVQYAPLSAGTLSDTIEVGYFNDVSSQTATRAVQGTAVNPASLSISNGPTLNFGTVAVGGAQDATLTVTNSGQYIASSMSGSGLAAPFNFKGGTYPGTGGTCTATLNAAASCTVVLTYSPSATGIQADVLDVDYNNGVSAQSASRSVQGTGATPATLTLSDGPTYDYGTVAQGASVDKTFTLSNTGGVPATSIAGGGLASPFSFKGGAYPGTGGTCAATLNAGAGCTIVVTYSPSSVGASSDTIDITYIDGVTGQSTGRNIQGTAVSPALLAISDGPLFDYGSVPTGGNSEKVFTITNSGGLTAASMSGGGLAAPFTYKGGTYPGTGGTCGATLNAAANCTVTVVFTPVATGTFSDAIEISYFNGASAQIGSRNIQGIGALPGTLVISDGPTYNFGSWPNGSTQEKAFTVTNTGGVPVTAIAGSGLAAPYTFKGGSYPGTGGTCAATLNAGANCTMIVQYSPSSLGATSDTIQLDYNNGVNAQTSNRNIQGTSVAPALLTVSDGATYDFGTRAVGGTGEKTFTITNSGSFAASSLSGGGLVAPFTFKGGSYPGTGGTCSTSLNVAATCTVVVVYSPSSTGVQAGQLDINYNNGVSGQTASRPLIGTGAAPALLTLSDGPSYDYGSVPVGASVDRSFTVTNSGGVNATTMSGGGLAAPFSFKGGSYPGTGGTCSTSLAASSACTVVVTYLPSAVTGSADAIDISYNDGAGAQSTSRNISGTGVAPASITISDGPTYNFGALANGATADKTFTLTNSGSYPASTMNGLGLAAPFTFKGGSYPGTGGTCGSTLNNGDNCTVVVTFAPTVSGSHTDTMDISFYSGASTVTSSRDVQGTSAAPASITISDGPTFAFGTRATGSSTDKSFTISNTGGVTATGFSGSGLAAPFTFKGGSYPGAGGNCSTSLNASASCTIVVTYAPSSTGAHADALDINYNDGVGAQAVSRNITGTGAAPATLTISDGLTYDYGTLAAGGTSDKAFTISNTGGVSATGINGSGLAAPFSFKGGSYPGTGGTCTTSLAAAGNCTVVVTFAPTVAGPFADTLDISYSDGVNAQTVSRDIQGTSVTPASLAISDGPTYNFGILPVTGSADKVFTVTNSGSLAASSVSGSGLAAPFSFKGGSYPGTGGTCGASINGGANCTIVLTFAPTANGAAGDSADLNYFDGAQNQTSSRAVQGTGAPPATLTISDGATYNFGNVATNGLAEKSFTVTNTGGVAATSMTGTGLAAPFSFKGGTYPGTGGSCTTSLAIASNCTIIVTFNPTALGAASDTIEIGYDNGLSAQSSTRAVQGTGVNPASLSISDGVTYDYGTWATGSTRDKTFTITNTGDVPATTVAGGGLAAPFTFRGGSFPGTGGTCTSTVNVSASCTIVVRYAPTSTGVQTDTIEISFEDGVGPQTATRAVQGTGANPALLTVSDGVTYDYGTLAAGGSADKTFTISNTGGVAASSMAGSGLAAPFAFKGGGYPGTAGTCGATLNAGANCTVVVTYNPTVVGSDSDALDITYNDGVNAQTASRAVQGTAVAPASITISDGAVYNFGTLANGATADKTFTLNNAGSFQATSMSGAGLAAPFSFKGGSYPGTGGSCGTSLNAGASCTVIVTFAPTISGLNSDSIEISFNDGAANQQSNRSIQGTGAAPALLAISDGATYDYGTRATGSSTDKTFTVSNSGGVGATSVNGSGLIAPFDFKGGSYPGTGGTCSTSIAASSSCTVVVTYSPTATGAQNDTLEMSYNDGVAGQLVSRPIQGVGAAPASLTITDGPTYDFGSVASGGVAEKIFTVANGGGVPATSISGAGIAAPFTFKGGTFPGTGGTCTATLAASANCTVVVAFSPSSAGLVNDTLEISYNNGIAAGQIASRDVQGTGVTPAILTISDGATYNFGPIVSTGSVDKSFTVTNSGSLAATSVSGSGLVPPFTFKGGSYPGTGGNCGATINAGANCTVIVTFNPTSVASFSDTIEIGYQDGAQAQNATRPLQGSGASPATITISDGATYNFGSLAVGATLDKTFTLTNGGGVTATSVTGTGLAAPFFFKGGSFPGTGGTCAATLAAAANCTVVVSYNPSTVAVHNDTIEIGFNDGLAAQTSNRAVTGTGVNPASLTISDGATYDFGTVATGGSAQKAFVVTNAGDYTASSMSGSGLAAPFTFVGGSYPGTGGTCSTTLNPAATCTVVVMYAPSSTGVQSDTIEIAYNDGASPQTSTRAVQGTGAAPATLTISDGVTYNYGTVANGSSTDKSFTVTNGGGVPATSVSGGGLAAPFSFKGGGYPGTGGTCGSTLAASANCTIVVTYNPSSLGTQSDSIEISYNDGVAGQTASRAIQGTAAAPATITISDGTTYNFGSKANGSSVDKTFTLTNSGAFVAASMTGGGLAAPYSFKGGSYPGTGGTCSTTLAASGTCTVIVTFAPTVSGTHNDTIDIGYHNGVSAQTSSRDVTGISAPPATLTISDGATYNFGTLATGSSTDKTFTINNTGGTDATTVSGAGLAAPFTFKGGSYPGTGGTCGTTIASAAACTVVVNYSPSATGAQSDTIELNYDDGVTASQQSTRAVQGTGAAPATITISDGATYNFGSIANGGSADKSFTISNTGGVSATSVSGSGLAAPFTFKGGSFPGTGGTCTAILAASANCTVIVTFAPTVSGAQADTLDISYNNGVSGGQISSRDVAGTGVTPAILAVSDGPTWDYGPVVLTGSSDKTFTISNSGSLGATTMAGTGLAAPFTFKGGSYPGTGGTCGATLAASGSCTIVVTFSPTATGGSNDTIDITYFDGAQNQTAPRPVQGTGATAASLTISDGATYNFGTVANGSSTDKTFTVTNGGGIIATSLGGSGLVAPFTFKGGSYPGTGGTCSTSLAAAAACTIVVNYNPSTLATHTDTIDITYNNGLSGQTSSRDVQGTAVAPASLTISDGATYDFGTLATGATLDKTFTINNGGAFTASALSGGGLAAPFTFKGGSYPGTGGSCSTTLNAAASCTIVVTYAPTATGNQSDSIEIAYNDGAAAQSATRAVQGTGAAPATLTISDGVTYNYGTVANGSSTDKSFTVTNAGGVTAVSISGGGLAAPFSFKGGGYPGTGGTCGTTLAASANCTVVVTYNPSSLGTQSDAIDISYNDGVAGQTASRAVQGTAAAPATITISDGATYNFGSKANGSSTDKTFTLTNSGAFGASSMSGSGLAAPYTFKGGGYPGTGGTCSTTLAASGTCTVVVTFAPTATGTHNDTIDISYNNGVSGQTASRDVTGISAPPATITISDGATYNFGTLATGSSTDKTFTINNTGGVDATSVSGAGLAAPFTYKGGSYPGAGGTCGATIASAANCTIVVNYSPVATGAQSDTIELTYNDGVTASQTSTRDVAGTGASPATITISDGATYNFGSIANGGSADKSFTVSNTGGVAATSLSGSGLAAPFTFKGGSYPGTGGTCSTSLAAASNCTVVVTFAPTVSGAQSDTLDISYNNGVSGGQTSSRDLTGTGVTPAVLAISDGPTYDYGPVVATGSSDKTFTVTNSGSLAATTVAGAGLAAPFTFKGGSYPGSGGTCGATIAAAGSCTIVVTFNPTITGAVSDTVDVTYYDGAQNQTAQRDVQGTGANAATITISDGATYNFGTLANGGTADKSFVLTNGGGVAATSMAGGGLAAPFTFKGGSYPGTGGTCTTSLAAAATCTIVVNYNPSTIATHNDTIDITYNNGLSGQTSSRDVQGTAVAPASLTISDGATYNFGTLATGASADKTFTINNGGGFAASAMSGSGLAAPFSFKGGTYPGSGGTCSTTLNASASCTIVVTYAPSGTGTLSDTIDIPYNDGAANQTAQRDIQGTGAAPATITISDGATYNFGSQATGSSTDKTFTISNTGGVAATSLSGGGLAAPFTFKGGTYPGTGGTCSTSLAASGNCTVIVTYAPTGVAVHNDTLEITFNNGVSGGQSSTRDLTGTALAPASLTLSDGSTYDFGTVVTTGAAEKSFTVTNGGGVAATGMSGSGLAAPFTFKGGSYPGTGGTCGTSLAAAGNCTIVVRFNPTVDGSFSDTVNINYNDGASAQVAVRDLSGVGAPVASISISDGATYNFGTIAQGGTAEKTFTLTNNGGVTASVMAGTGLAAPYSFKGGSYPGTGGSCSTSLASTVTCTIVVVYSPTSVATHNDSIEINYNDGTTGQTATRAVTGTAVAPASLAINNGPTYDYGAVATGTVNEATFTITNSGSFSASSMAGGGLAAPFTFKGGSYPGTGGTCSTSLAAAGSCTVVVLYSPTATGVQSDTIEITYNDGANAQNATRAVQGTGAAPALLTLSDGPGFDYGTRANGSSSDKTFVVTNSGGLSATSVSGGGLAAPFTYKGGTFPGTGGSCSATLASSGTCTIVVTFAPSSTGSHSDTVEVSYADGSGATPTATRNVSGASAPPAVITISDGATYNFGTLVNGTSGDKSFTISNTGGVTATSLTGGGIAAPFTFKDGSYPGTGGNCGSSLAAGGSCTVVVTFSPTVSTSYNDALDMQYNDGVTTQISSRDLAGAGGPPASITISDGATYNYGTVANGSTNEKVFTLSNIGGASATAMAGAGLAAPFTFKGGSYPGTGGTCSTTLTGSANCTIVVVYSPTTVTTHNDTIDINYNDGAAAQTSSRPVTGTAVAPASLTISDATTYDYGTQPLTKATDKTFTVTNSGDFSASSMSGTGLSAPFAFKGGSYPGTGGTCSSALGASANCTIVVTYTPTSTGVQSGTIDVNYNNGASVQVAQRGVQGVGATAAILSISDGPTYNFGTQTIGLSAEKTFTVTNSGGVSATSVSGGGLASPFFYKGGTYPGTGGNCSSTLGGGSNCTIVVVFTPASGGPQADTIDISYNDGLAAQSATRDVQATGATPAALTISDGATYNFGTLETAVTSDKTFTINNTGGVTATGIGGSGLASPFSFKGGTFPGTGGSCSSTLGASASCTVIVTFAPLSTGVANDTIEIAYNDSVAAQSVTRDVTGTGAAPTAPTGLTRLLPAATPNNLSSVTIRVTGVAEANVVKLFTDSSCTTQVASGTVGVGASQIDVVWGTLSTDGAYTFYANRTNAAGTISACSTATASYTRDTVAPSITTINNQDPGRTPHWDDTPTFRVLGSWEIGDTVRLYSDSGCTTQVATGATANVTDIDLTPSISSQGTYTYYARGFDSANNSSSCFATPITYNYDYTDVTVAFDNWSQIVTENSTVTVPVTMSSSKPYAVTIYYKMLGTAVVGTHVSGVSASGSFIIPANTASYNFTFSAPENGTAEKDKYVDLAMWDSSYEYVHPGGKIYHRVIVRDNDSAVGTPVALPYGNGYATSCFIDANNKLYCVGANTYGTVGDGTTTDRSQYVAVDSSVNYTQVSIGRSHACALTSAGAVKCWGFDGYGQVGNGGAVNIADYFSTPQELTSLGTGNKFVATGANFSCAINSSDKLYCWGRNANRQVGDNTTTDRSSPVAIDSTNNYLKAAMADDNMCALRSDGKIYCWGSNGNGANGNASTGGNQGTLYANDAANTFIDITMGDNHGCGLTNAFKLRCWGVNGNGQLGDGSTTQRTSPVSVDAATNYSSVRAGRVHTCGITASGGLRCTGNNAFGQLFDRTTEQATSYFDVAAGLTFSKIAAFEDSTWAQTTGGEVYYGGGDLPFAFSGDGVSTMVRVAPQAIDDSRTFSAMDTGYGDRSFCAISSNKIRCSGFSSTEGIFGIGSEPLIVGSIWSDARNSYSQVGSGRNHMCALRSNGKLFCAGHATYSGTGSLSNTLNAVDSSNNYSAISVGYNHSCGIRTSGALTCWGAGGSGRLGTGSGTNQSLPQLIDSGTNYAKVSLGIAHSCGITTGNVLKCWGDNGNGRLGDNSGSNQTSPVVVDSGVSYAEISAGENHTCGVTTGGNLKCWGNNGSGQFGNNNTTSSNTPVTITGGANYAKVAASLNATCVIMANPVGELRCAGNWTTGLAGGTDTNWDAFQTVDSGTTYTDIRAGRYSICAKDSANRVRCWGNNYYNTFGSTQNIWFPDAVPQPGFRQ